MAYKGEVVLWHRQKGFGFVKCADFDDDLFVHHTAFGSGDLIEGKELTFDVEDDSRGAKKRCSNVEGEAIDRSGPSRQGGGGGGGRPDNRECYKCGRTGHISRYARGCTRTLTLTHSHALVQGLPGWRPPWRRPSGRPPP